VQCLTGDAVWEAQRQKQFDPELFEAALGRLSHPPDGRRPLSELVKAPILWRVEYVDGLRATVLELNGLSGEWTGAWRLRDDRRIDATQFWTQEARPAAHFTLLLHAIEKLMLTREVSWNVERTLLTTGLLDALLQSRLAGGVPRETPYLQFGYQPIWRWQQPPPPPPGRPWSEQ
jgi:hypothetical protein